METMKNTVNDNTTIEERFMKCPYATAQTLISGKWATLILHYLEDGPIRFNDLLRKMPKMTHATLSVQLKTLVDNGLVERVRQSISKATPRLRLSTWSVTTPRLTPLKGRSSWVSR